MKKTLITTALCVITVASAMAQGRINFANAGGTASTATPIRINNGSVEAPGPITQILGTASTAQFGIGPASAQIRLYAGLTSSSLAPVLIGTANAAFVLNTSSTLAGAQGSFAGNNIAGGLTLPGFDGSSPVFLQFTATSVNGLYAGTSPIIQVSLATGTALSTTVFSANPVAGAQWNGITMYAVPEPSSMALAGLGAASLLIFRRRK